MYVSALTSELTSCKKRRGVMSIASAEGSTHKHAQDAGSVRQRWTLEAQIRAVWLGIGLKSALARPRMFFVPDPWRERLTLARIAEPTGTRSPSLDALAMTFALTLRPPFFPLCVVMYCNSYTMLTTKLTGPYRDSLR